ncbi:cytochrome P450 [Vararia minispora EC-137]|uniref:Cytochrome P450 n=1 Tax=Vararia minispora EC-137 TaxID=1314806 RepID=A0ACB8QCL6_9AGAM|nr:cytochrome P450 [Vararia minispora EC-137]
MATQPLVVAGIVVASAALVAWRALRHDLLLPPGPRGHWLYGNDFPKFKCYHEWSKVYGPVYTLHDGLKTIIVICGYQAAMDILEKEGAATADRPRMVAGGEIRSGDMRILFVGVGERLKKLRRALHSHLQSRVAPKYEETQAFNARQLIRDILEDPDGLFEHTQRYAASVILSVTYGKPSPSRKSDPDVTLLHQMLANLGQALRPGAWAVDQLPWLKYLPFYASTLREEHQQELELFSRQLQAVGDEVAVGVAPPSFGNYLLQSQKDLALSDNELAYLAGSMFGAGAETTAAGLRIVVMAAAIYPEIQCKIQDELDSVVGHDRLPTFTDWDLLPNVRAFVLETFRWRPGTAVGMQHRATKDVIWIPAGATIIPNHWSIGRDPEVWPNGDDFIPDRWLDSNGRVQDKPAFPNFGFGRRSCPGQPVAERSLFLNTALLLHSFSIAQDPSRPIDPLTFKHSVITQPGPFSARFTVRNPGGAEALFAMLDAS